MEFGIKGNINPGEGFDINEALGAVQSSSTEQAPKEQPKQEAREEIKDEVKEAKTLEQVVDEGVKEQPKETTLDESAVLGWINQQNSTTFESLSDYQASLTKEVEKQVEVEKVVEVNPYENLSEETLKFLEFEKSTGRSFNDYLSLQKDWDAVSDADLARARAKEETGLDLSNTQADEYIASELGIDLEDLEGSDKIKFQAYANKFRKARKSEQAELSKAVPKEAVKKTEAKPTEEMVELANGQIMPKAQYDKLLKNQKIYLQNTQKAVDSITDISFNVNVNDNGESREFKYAYNVTEDDKHSMLSLAQEGIEAFLSNEFSDKEGKMNIKDFQESMLFARKATRDKILKAYREQIRAEAIEEYLKDKNNVNFSQKSLKQDTSKKAASIDDVVNSPSRRGFGVIGNL